VWNDKGVYLSNQYKYSVSEELKCYEKAISLDPNLALPWYNKGVVFYDQKKYSDAITCYDKAIAINPNYAKAWWNKGIVLQKLNRYTEANTCFNKAKQLDPKYLYW